MGLFDGVPVVGGIEDAAGTVVTGTADIGADFVNTTTGRCVPAGTCGLFGEIDREADPRDAFGYRDFTEEGMENRAVQDDQTGATGAVTAALQAGAGGLAGVFAPTTNPAIVGDDSPAADPPEEQQEQRQRGQQDGPTPGQQNQPGGPPLGLVLVVLAALGGAAYYAGGGS